MKAYISAGRRYRSLFSIVTNGDSGSITRIILESNALLIYTAHAKLEEKI